MIPAAGFAAGLALVSTSVCGNFRYEGSIAIRILPPLLLAVVGIVFAKAGDPAVHAAEATDPAGQTPHGPVELLQQKLVQGTNSDRLLNNAVRLLRAGQTTDAFQAIRLILSEPQDSFTRIDANSSAVSIRQSARQLLQNADFAVRRDWIVAHELTAESALQQALLSRDEAALRAVARTYPFTRAAFRSLQLQALTAADRGQFVSASELLSEITELYVTTPLPYSVEQATAALQSRIAQVRRAHQSADSAAVRVTRAGSPYQTTVPALSRPWTEPLWTWTERYWSHPASAGVLSTISDNSQADLLSVNTWQSLLLGDRLVFRSPLRVICFDRLSGRVEWSLRTDTGATVDPAAIGEGKPIPIRTPVDAATLLQMECLGTMCGDDRLLFFIDGFRPFDDLSDASTTIQHVLPGPLGGQIGNRFSVPSEERSLSAGTRLVAVQLSSPPRVIWSVGGRDAFDYEFTAGANAQASTQPAQTREHDAAGLTGDPFRQQRFLGVPLIHDQSLFVISSDGEQLFLNSLNRSSGRLSWRQPLTFDDGAADERRYSGGATARSSELSALCGVADDSVICSLPDGILIAVSRHDGRLKWATDISGPDDSASDPANPWGPARRLFALVRRADALAFRPVICGHRIFHAAPGSQVLSCLDVRTGRIEWQVSRQAAGQGVVSSSRDLYAAACSDAGLVLIGQRHLRVVEPETGVQVLVTEIPPQTGRAICDDRLCLIPVQDGAIVAADLAAGSIDSLPGVLLHTPATPFTGSLVADDGVICATTPVSVAVIPTAAEMRRRFTRQAEMEQSESAASSVSMARAEILSGHPVVGLQRLLDVSRQPDSAPTAHPVLADILLHRLAETRFDTQAEAAASERPSELASAEQIVAALKQLNLSPEQSLRMNILSGVPSGHTIREVEAVDATMLQLLPDWRVRADVAAWSMAASHVDTPATDWRAANPPTLVSAARVISFPSCLDSADATLQFADELIRQQRPAAAHLVLAAADATAGITPAGSTTARLQQLRSEAGPRRSAAKQSNGSAGVQLTMREVRTEAIDANVLQAIREGLRSQVDSPAWFEHRLLTTLSPGRPQLSVLDMHAGRVIHEVPLPSSLRQNFGWADSHGLLPLLDGDQIGMLSLIGRDGPEVLWHKRIVADGLTVSGVQPGPVGPAYFVWRTDSQLCCSHPLTGELLWCRKLAMSSGSAAGAPISGDGHAIAVFAPGMDSYQLFRTLDGRHLRDGQLAIPNSQTPVLLGRRLLYVDDDRRIRLLDLLTGQDALNTPVPLRITEHGRASVLPNNRAATVTDDRRLVIIDADHAAVELSCPLPDEATANPFTGLVAFERDGRLFVLLRNYRHNDQSMSATPLLQEPRLDYGTLLCIDQTSQELLWTISGQPAVVPPIYGDPTDLIVLWSIVDPLDARRLGQNQLRQNGNFFGDDTRPAPTGTDRNLVLRVIDCRTGQTIARQSGFSPATPLRCVHNADARQIRVELENSVILLDYVPLAGP